ncbi:MAG: DUF58 domain-containing protein [Akkermansiaceae bacterium]|nr:DUF58 domain-containing protein [Akkermansiaceae bacterium]MBR3696142.1 DUF58 domain-containing protein [Akkermansia sp.]
MDKTQEIMQKVRRIELTARRLTTATLSGQYRASFRGQGLEFDDFREYQPGDDPRFIDWKVTARTGSPYVRRFHEEREQVLLLAVDTSASMRYASSKSNYSKLEYAALISAVLAYSAARNGDNVGLLLYGCHPHFYLPPAKGMKQCLRIIREIISVANSGQDVGIEEVAAEILRTQRKRTMCFLISDFMMPADKQAIGKLNFRHELIPLRVADAMELELPQDAGTVCIQDPESGTPYHVNLSSPAVRKAYTRAMLAHRAEWEGIFTQLGIDMRDLRTDADFVPALRALFTRRSSHFAR